MERRRASVDRRNSSSQDRKSSTGSVNESNVRRKSDASPQATLDGRKPPVRRISVDVSAKINDSDDDVPEIDHSDPIHSVRRSLRLSCDSMPTYESLLREKSLDEFNRELYSYLKKNKKGQGDGVFEEEEESKEGNVPKKTHLKASILQTYEEMSDESFIKEMTSITTNGEAAFDGQFLLR